MKGFSIIEANEPLSVSSLFLVLYGLPGVGKTSLSFTMPGNVLHLDADRGLRRAVQKKRPNSVEVTEYGGLYDWVMSQAFADYVAQNGIKSVAIDTAGALLDDLVAPWLIRKDMKNGNAMGALSLPGYGALKSNFKNLIGRVRSLGLNVCCLAHAKEEGEANTRRFELAVSGGSKDAIYAISDLIGFVSIQPDGSRVINFNPTAQNIGKNTGNLPVMTVPDAALPEYDTFLSGVIDRVFARMNEATEAQREFSEALQVWKDQLDNYSTPDDLQGFAKSAAELPDGALKTHLRSMLSSKVETLGFRFDKGKIVNPNAKAETVPADETH